MAHTKLYIVIFSIILVFNGYAKKNHNRDTSLSKFDGDFAKPLTVKKMRTLLEIRGEVYLLDPDGNRVLYKLPQWRKWRSRHGDTPIESNWGIESEGHANLAIHHTWTVNEQGEIQVLIEQYDSIEPIPGPEGKVEYGKLLKRKKFTLSNFEPVNWVSVNEKKRRMVVRFTPLIRDEDSAQPISEVPISGKDMTVTDSVGSVWTEHISAQSKYLGLITHKGTLLFSYYPFKGAKEMGIAKGSRIELKLADGKTVTISSQTPFLPEGVPTTVYAQYRAELKTAHLGSTKVNSSDREDEFLEHVER